VIDWAVKGEMSAVRRLGVARVVEMHWQQDDAARMEWRREVERLARLPASAQKVTAVAPVVAAVAPKQGRLL
jgi:L-ascorbate metabolism protein UlaG (beta-lactamase superfamily)